MLLGVEVINSKMRNNVMETRVIWFMKLYDLIEFALFCIGYLFLIFGLYCVDIVYEIGLCLNLLA